MYEDGLYRLQTVRYESLELTETMMCESSENIDDPNTLMNDGDENNVDEPNAFCTEQALISDNNINPNNDMSTTPESVLLCLNNDVSIDLQQNTAVANASVRTSVMEESNSQQPEQEPVLINIVDAEDKLSTSGGSVLLIKTSRPMSFDHKQSVQLITKDSSGRVLLETAEIITQYVESDRS